MPFLEETPGSMRAYLLVIGLWGTVFNLPGMISSASVYGPVGRLIHSVAFIVSVAYAVVGFSLKSLLAANPHRIEQVLIGGTIGYSLVYVGAVFFGPPGGAFGAMLSLPIGVIITVYLLKQVRRLAAQGQSPNPTASSTEFTSIRRKLEP